MRLWTVVMSFPLRARANFIAVNDVAALPTWKLKEKGRIHLAGGQIPGHGMTLSNFGRMTCAVIILSDLEKGIAREVTSGSGLFCLPMV